MNLRDFEYIVRISELGSFAKAADACHVSQSTLSIQVKKLEEYLGVQLFERTNKHVMLTPEGAKICEAAKASLREASNIRQIAADAKDPAAGELYLGAFPTLAPYLFPRMVEKLKGTFPKLKLMLVEEKTDTLLEKLREGAIDCALIALPVEDDALEHIELFFEPFFLAVPEGHELAKKTSAKNAMLLHEEILLLDEGHCLRGQSLEFCTRIGIGESGRYRATSLETLRNMVAAGGGITIIPKLAIPKEGSIGIRYLKLESPEVGRKIALFYRKTSARGALFARIAEQIKASTKSLGSN